MRFFLLFVWVLSWGWRAYAEDGTSLRQPGCLTDGSGDEPKFELKGRFIQVQSGTGQRSGGADDPRVGSF